MIENNTFTVFMFKNCVSVWDNDSESTIFIENHHFNGRQMQ